MKQLLPAPLLSLVLFIAWPVLNASWSLGQLLIGALLGLAIPLLTEPLRDERAILRRPAAALRLALVVLWGIVASNIEVAKRILGPEAAIHPGFVWVPLAITDPHGIVVLAGIITMTPGTLSAELSPDRRHLLIHAFSIDEAGALIATIKSRYKAPLQQIFEVVDA